MIKLDFSTGIAIYITIILILVFGRWIFYTLSGNQCNLNDSKYIWQCPYCTYVFFGYMDKDTQNCPRCKSYISTDDMDKRENIIARKKRHLRGKI